MTSLHEGIKATASGQGWEDEAGYWGTPTELYSSPPSEWQRHCHVGT